MRLTQRTIKVCSICGFIFKDHATITAHMATHIDRHCSVVGVCPVCGNPSEYFGTNASKAKKVGNAAGWKCDRCKNEVESSQKG